MATQRPALGASFGAFAGQLLAEREIAPRARVIAAEASARLPGTAVVVYLFDAAAHPRWTSKASVGDIKVPAQCEALTLAMLAEQREPLLFSGAELVREHYAHLDVRRTIASLAYVPLLSGETLLGAIEAVSLDRVLNRDDLAELSELAELSSRAIAAALSYESERNSNFETITRLTAFYDVEKVFHSTLLIGHLLPIICSKTRELLPADAVNLWMVDDDTLALMARDGEDRSLAMGAPQDEVVAWVAEKGRALTIRDRNNPILAKRNRTGTIRGVAAVPIVDSGALVGVLECVNKADGAAFNDDDVFLLSTVAETAAGALHNASLLEAERKIEILETLVEVSQEITSTLNLTRVLQVLVNAPQRIMAYDRAAVALGEPGRLQVRAISGKPEVVQSDPTVKTLRETLSWTAETEGDLYVTTHGGKVESDREDARAKFLEYFKLTGFRTWYSVPLADEQGQLGVLVFESKKPDFLSEAQFELIKVLAAQATVALRNASLYEQVPLIGMLEPILHRKQQFMRMEKGRRIAYGVAAAAALVFLVVVPLPMRVEGHATVAPQRTAQVQVEADGVVRAVHVREGDPVKRGTILAELEDWDYRSALAGAEAKRQEALAQVNQALANNDGGEAGMKRVQAEYWQSEVQRAQERLDHSLLRSPIDGVVATPHLESMVGRKLLAGQSFAQVLDSVRTSIDVSVDQKDLPLVAAGQETSVKLEGYPTHKFHGQVSVVSPTSGMENDKRVFFARVDVPNESGLIRSGMEGQAKVFTGWRPAGYVIFRDIGTWAWSKVWNWFGS
jgi:RND family efflux transporter MFP subunit